MELTHGSLTKVGDGYISALNWEGRAMVFPTYTSPHWCSFRRVSGTTRQTKLVTEWTDKCRCGRIILVRMRPGVDGHVLIEKDWYDKEGVFQRSTGQNAKTENEPKTPLKHTSV